MKNRIAYALIVAVAGSIALAGCKKPESATPTPAATEPAPAPATAPAPAPAPTATFTVGNTAAVDKSVAPLATFGTKDKIIVSVKTDVGVPANATINAKLTYQDGQTAGDKSATVVAGGTDTTNIEFTNTNPWPTGTYKVDVTLNGAPVGMTQSIEIK